MHKQATHRQFCSETANLPEYILYAGKKVAD